MEIVITNPTGVYGPGPSSSHTLENGLFQPLVEKKLPALVPGGMGVVFVDGVVQGHLAAADRGVDGERYILTDTYVTLVELAEEVVRVAGRGRVPPTMPVPVAKVFAAAGEAVSMRHQEAPDARPGPAHLLPVAGPRRLVEGPARTRLHPHPARGRRPPHPRVRWGWP